MALPGAVEYAAPVVRETYEALHRQQAFAEQVALRAGSKLRSKRDDARHAQRLLQEAQARLREFSAAKVAAGGTAAERHFADQLGPLEAAVEQRQKNYDAARAVEAEAQRVYDDRRAEADALEQRMKVIEEAA